MAIEAAMRSNRVTDPSHRVQLEAAKQHRDEKLAEVYSKPYGPGVSVTSPNYADAVSAWGQRLPIGSVAPTRSPLLLPAVAPNTSSYVPSSAGQYSGYSPQPTSVASKPATLVSQYVKPSGQGGIGHM